jgi:hypothetical protein
VANLPPVRHALLADLPHREWWEAVVQVQVGAPSPTEQTLHLRTARHNTAQRQARRVHVTVNNLLCDLRQAAGCM